MEGISVNGKLVVPVECTHTGPWRGLMTFGPTYVLLRQVKNFNPFSTHHDPRMYNKILDWIHELSLYLYFSFICSYTGTSTSGFKCFWSFQCFGFCRESSWYIWCCSLRGYFGNFPCDGAEHQRSASCHRRTQFTKRGILDFNFLMELGVAYEVEFRSFSFCVSNWCNFILLTNVLEGARMEHLEERTFGACGNWSSNWSWHRTSYSSEI